MTINEIPTNKQVFFCMPICAEILTKIRVLWHIPYISGDFPAILAVRLLEMTKKNGRKFPPVDKLLLQYPHIIAKSMTSLMSCT